MPIYEAKFLGEPTPIKKGKKSRAKKEEIATPAPPAPVEVTPPPVEAVKPKAPRKRKVKAAVAVEAPPPPSPVEEKVVPAVVAEPEKKKRRKREPKVTIQEPISAVEEDVKEEKKKDKKKAKVSIAHKDIIDGDVADDPPSWFKSYLLTEERRRNSDKEKKNQMPVKEIKQVASAKASEKWNDGLTRDKVNNEVHGHMNRLFSQIHGRKF